MALCVYVCVCVWTLGFKAHTNEMCFLRNFSSKCLQNICLSTWSFTFKLYSVFSFPIVLFLFGSNLLIHSLIWKWKLSFLPSLLSFFQNFNQDFTLKMFLKIYVLFRGEREASGTKVIEKPKMSFFFLLKPRLWNIENGI